MGDQDELAVADRFDGGSLDLRIDLDRVRRAGPRAVQRDRQGFGLDPDRVGRGTRHAEGQEPEQDQARSSAVLPWDIGIVFLREG